MLAQFGANTAIDYVFGNNVFGDIAKYVTGEAIDGLTNITLRAADGNVVTLEFNEKTYPDVHLTDETFVACTPGCTAWNPSPVVSLKEREVYQCNVTLEDTQLTLPRSTVVCPETSSLLPQLDTSSKITQFYDETSNDCVSKNTGKVCFDNANKNIFIYIAGGVMIVVVGGAAILTITSTVRFTKKYLFDQREKTKETVNQILNKCSFRLFGKSVNEASNPPDEEIGYEEEKRPLVPKK